MQSTPYISNPFTDFLAVKRFLSLQWLCFIGNIAKCPGGGDTMPSPPRWLGRSSHHTDSIQQHHTEHSCMDSRLHYAFLQSASLQCWFFFWFPRYSLCSRVQTVKQLSDLHCFGCFCKLRIVVKVAAHLLLTFLSDPDHLGVRQVEHIDSIDCEQNVAHTGEERDWREKGRVIKSYHEYIEVSLHQKDPGLKEMYQKELQTWKKFQQHLRPEDSAGVPCSMAETTTGREPWIRKPNSPSTLCTSTVLLHSGGRRFTVMHCFHDTELFFTYIHCDTPETKEN